MVAQRLGGSQWRRRASIRDRFPRRPAVSFKELDTVVLVHDVPANGLKRGDLGTVVQTYSPDGLEVEFVTASGRTGALVTLNVKDVRPVADDDLVSVRRYGRAI